MKFIGMIATREASEIVCPRGAAHRLPIHGPLRAGARGGRVRPRPDRLCRTYWADGFVVADDVLAHPAARSAARSPAGIRAPTVAARKLATLDLFSGGRAAVHMIIGRERRGSAARRRLPRPRRALSPHRRVPRSSTRPLDGGRPRRPRGRVLPLRGRLAGGAAGAAAVPADLLRRLLGRGDRGGARHADVYALWGEPLDAVRGAHRPRYGLPRRRPAARLRFSLSLRAILGPTEEAAWARAHALLAQVRANAAAKGLATAARSESVGSRGRGCSRPQPPATSTTPVSTPRSPRRPVRAATRPHSWHRRASGGVAAGLRRSRHQALLLRGFDPLRGCARTPADRRPRGAEVARRDAVAQLRRVTRARRPRPCPGRRRCTS